MSITAFQRMRREAEAKKQADAKEQADAIEKELKKKETKSKGAE